MLFSSLLEDDRTVESGDDRGRVYRGAVQKLGQSYEMANSSHGCGGA